jgi:hypothetical protein
MDLSDKIRILEKKAERADYILGEVEAHISGKAVRIDEKTFTLDVDFMNWFLRQWEKYKNLSK